jgi:hypothetical protein
LFYYIVDIVLDAVVGTIGYKQLKASTDPWIQKKLLISKWLFATGILITPNFPPEEPYLIIHDDADDPEPLEGPACTTRPLSL